MITVLLNDAAGRASEIRDALAAHPALSARAVPPDELGREIEALVAAGSARVAIAGGDGTVATAAAALAGTRVELAVIPGGTLNHFAGDHGVPTDLADACALATSEARVVAVDVGRVNDRLMLNTSAVGAYTFFVRERERLERRMGYRVASLVAAARTLRHLRPVRVEVEVQGQLRVYHTPLLFVGVGEREVRVPMLGGRVQGGRRGLHVLVVRRRTAWGLLASALLGALRGVREISRTRHVDAFLVERCRVHLHRRSIIAVDGELLALDRTIEYRLEREALRVVVPAPEK
ncbi:MAG TPA: diacylglycerol kinase family protein [Gemmatimonadaceae bacterium]|nr:diacylglycerol kinase family protein [Gemmatimonadaceae bacterium]